METFAALTPITALHELRYSKDKRARSLSARLMMPKEVKEEYDRYVKEIKEVYKNRKTEIGALENPTTEQVKTIKSRWKSKMPNIPTRSVNYGSGNFDVVTAVESYYDEDFEIRKGDTISVYGAIPRTALKKLTAEDAVIKRLKEGNALAEKGKVKHAMEIFKELETIHIGAAVFGKKKTPKGRYMTLRDITVHKNYLKNKNGNIIAKYKNVKFSIAPIEITEEPVDVSASINKLRKKFGI